MLHRRSRYDEFAQFLDWMLETIEAESVDALLIAGDIFDTTTPSNRATELYYQFLGRLMKTACKHVVVTAGNHDSPSFLQAPQAVLRFLNVHVLVSAESPEAEVLTLCDQSGAPELIVCAVPYLRDRDIRKSAAGESGEDKDRNLIDGIHAHYELVGKIAARTVAQLDQSVPVIGMGHLFAAGGETSDDDGVRELYVGSLARIGAETFPANMNYVALGHLHVPQRVGGTEHIRYCGSPIAMGFGEAHQLKQVLLVDFDGVEISQITARPVPCFQPLERVRGDLATIEAALEKLKAEKSRAWLEVVYDGEEIVGNLREQVDAWLDGSELEVLRLKNTRLVQRVLGAMQAEESLDDLDELDVFTRCLDAHEIPEPQRPELLADYRSVLQALQESDEAAE
jgi:exonuclease SbcD